MEVDGNASTNVGRAGRKQWRRKAAAEPRNGANTGAGTESAVQGQGAGERPGREAEKSLGPLPNAWMDVVDRSRKAAMARNAPCRGGNIGANLHGIYAQLFARRAVPGNGSAVGGSGLWAGKTKRCGMVAAPRPRGAA